MLMKLAPKKRRNPRSFYLSVAAVLVIAGAGRYFAYKGEQERAAQQAELGGRLASLNAALPRKVDALTTLEYIGLMGGDKIFYRYRIDRPARMFSEELMASMQVRARSGLERLACKEPQLMEAMRKYRIHQEHSYLGRDGVLFSVEIHPDQLNCPG